MSRSAVRAGTTLVAALATAVVAGCAAGPPDAAPAAVRTEVATAPDVREDPPVPADGPSLAEGSAPAATTPAPQPRSRPEPRRSYLTVPALGLRAVPVVRYLGTPDDAEGTRIQDGGPTASPRGRRGGVGPGEVGNFIVTGHRTSHAAPFRDLPALERGDRVQVRTGKVTHVYRITTTRRTSFRSARSLAEQSAAVPGRPGATPVRAMLTLSTCATPEDHAAGNYWSDRFGNPEHRIDKIGVLVTSRTVTP